MDLRELLVSLRDAKEPSKILDVEIGKIFGYVQNFDRSWVSPQSEALDILPRFTADLDDAALLTAGLPCGASWEVDKGSARVGDGKYFQAASPAIALCIASVLAKAEADRVT